jgi:predicted nucleotidyltransferase/phosphopantetheine adenylyltransferase
MKRFKDFKKANNKIIESIIDIPRRTYAPGVFDDADTYNPRLKQSVINIIKNDIEKHIELYGEIERVYIIGSILTKTYRDDADVDIDIVIKPNAVGEEKIEKVRRELVKKFMGEINGKNIPGTKHPINYYIQVDRQISDDHLKNADGHFDVLNNMFTKVPNIPKFNINLYIKGFSKRIQEIDIIKGELKRDIIDYDELKSLSVDDVLNLQEKIKDKLEEIEDSITKIKDIGDDLSLKRKEVFLKGMTPEEIKTYGVANNMPVNVIFKLLEKYHYITFYKKCKEILDDGIVTDDEIDSLKMHEDINLNDIKMAAQKFVLSIKDKLKNILTTSKRYEYAAKVLQDVIDRKKKERAKEGLPLRHDIGYYAAAVANTFKDIDSRKLQTMIKEEHIEEAKEKSIAFAFGRFNPPTVGHEKLIQKVASVPANDYRIYISRSQDPKKNPLSPNDKLKVMKDMFPRYSNKIEIIPSNMVLELAAKLYNKGYTKVIMVSGSDRVREFEDILKKYNDVKSRHGYYNFDNISVVSAGERDPDAEGVSGMSASKMRAAAEKGDLKAFSQGLPSSYKNVPVLMKLVRRGMNLAAATDYGTSGSVGAFLGYREKPIASLEQFEQQQIRDLYIREMIFNIGDKVDYVKEDIQGIVKRRGTNYVVLEDNNNNLHKAWIWDCIPIAADREIEVREYNLDVDYGFKAVSEIIEDTDKTPQDKTVGKKPGTQPKKYYKDLSKGEKEKRADFFKKQKYKKSDDEDDYKPAPGDKGKKTKPSIHTQKYKKMFGELKKELSDACWKGYKQVGMKDKNGRQVPNCVPEAYDIGHDYAQHTIKTTPGQPGYDPNYKGSEYKPSKPEDNKKRVYTDVKKGLIDRESVNQKDIEEWALSDNTIHKYRERYKEQWRSKLDEVVKRMIEKLNEDF